jgi:hypothetical protein
VHAEQIAERQKGRGREIVRRGGRTMSNRENKAAAGEFRQLVGIDFEEFTRRTSVKLLLALSKFAEPINMAVLQFADEKYPLFQQQRERLLRTCTTLGNVGDRTSARRQQITEVVRQFRDSARPELEGGGDSGRADTH